MMGGAHGNLTQTIKDLIVTHKMNPTKILNRSPFLTERHGQDRIQVIQNTFDDMIKGRIKKVEKIFEI